MSKQNGTQKETWRDVYQSDHLTAHDFEDDTDTVVVLQKAWKEEVTGEKGRKEMCVVGQFKGMDRPAVLNITNCKMITKFTGTRVYEEWKNVPLSIHTIEGKYDGEERKMWRVRPVQPKLTKPELTPTHPKWAGAVKNLAAETTTIEAIRKHYTVSDQNGSKMAQEAAKLQGATDAPD